MNGMTKGHGGLIGLTVSLVSAYAANNSVQRSDLSSLIEAVYSALASLGAPQPALESQKPTPPISIKKSITPDYLVSMEDGRRYKSLRRHLSGRGLTPDEYRMKWNLPRDYPMVAPNYAKERSDLARAMGLGRKRESAPTPEALRTATAPEQPASASDARRRKRKKAA